MCSTLCLLLIQTESLSNFLSFIIFEHTRNDKSVQKEALGCLCMRQCANVTEQPSNTTELLSPNEQRHVENKDKLDSDSSHKSDSSAPGKPGGCLIVYAQMLLILYLNDSHFFVNQLLLMLHNEGLDIFPFFKMLNSWKHCYQIISMQRNIGCIKSQLFAWFNRGARAQRKLLTSDDREKYRGSSKKSNCCWLSSKILCMMSWIKQRQWAGNSFRPVNTELFENFEKLEVQGLICSERNQNFLRWKED